jgi:hypothetical protein
MHISQAILPPIRNTPNRPSMIRWAVPAFSGVQFIGKEDGIVSTSKYVYLTWRTLSPRFYTAQGLNINCIYVMSALVLHLA